MRLPAALGALAVITACTADPVTTVQPPLPAIDAVTVTANPNNALSAVVSVRVRLADSVAVLYGAGPTLDSVTAAVVPVGESAVVPVLGLLPSTTYALRVMAYRGDQAVPGGLIGFTTEPLPFDLPSYSASGTDPSPGYVAFSAGLYGLVIDNTGRVVWYRRFTGGPGLNFQPQANGRYVARPPNAAPAAAWVEVDPLGNVTRTFGCARGLTARFHDLIAESDGSYWMLCDETRTMNLSALGGVAAAQVTGTVVQHLNAAGAILFEWSPFDHFQITDLAAASRTGASVNWTHGNALTLDADGNLIMSFRSLSEITKIDTRTGAVLWRMGGLRNQFTFEGGASTGFAWQHGLRVIAPGRLMLLDNLGDPAASRAERYVYDAQLRTVRLVASYGPTPAVVAQQGGTTQQLSGGRTLVAFGNGNRVEEYDLSGRMVWHIVGTSGYVFRAQRISSLYTLAP
jgi:hypothetical protein